MKLMELVENENVRKRKVLLEAIISECIGKILKINPDEKDLVVNVGGDERGVRAISITIYRDIDDIEREWEVEIPEEWLERLLK